MKKKTTNDEKNVSLIKQVLTSEVKFVIGVVGFVMGVVAPYYSLKQDVALIQKDISNINSNHEAHIQDLTQSLKDTIVAVQGQQAQIVELQKQQAIVLTKLK